MDAELIIIDIVMQKINELIDEEMEVAKGINPQMAMGMLQIKKIINKEFDFNEED